MVHDDRPQHEIDADAAEDNHFTQGGNSRKDFDIKAIHTAGGYAEGGGGKAFPSEEQQEYDRNQDGAHALFIHMVTRVEQIDISLHRIWDMMANLSIKIDEESTAMRQAMQEAQARQEDALNYKNQYTDLQTYLIDMIAAFEREYVTLPMQDGDDAAKVRLVFEDENGYYMLSDYGDRTDITDPASLEIIKEQLTSGKSIADPNDLAIQDYYNKRPDYLDALDNTMSCTDESCSARDLVADKATVLKLLREQWAGLQEQEKNLINELEQLNGDFPDAANIDILRAQIEQSETAADIDYDRLATLIAEDPDLFDTFMGLFNQNEQELMTVSAQQNDGLSIIGEISIVPAFNNAADGNMYMFAMDEEVDMGEVEEVEVDDLFSSETDDIQGMELTPDQQQERLTKIKNDLIDQYKHGGVSLPELRERLEEEGITKPSLIMQAVETLRDENVEVKIPVAPSPSTEFNTLSANPYEKKDLKPLSGQFSMAAADTTPAPGQSAPVFDTKPEHNPSNPIPAPDMGISGA